MHARRTSKDITKREDVGESLLWTDYNQCSCFSKQTLEPVSSLIKNCFAGNQSSQKKEGTRKTSSEVGNTVILSSFGIGKKKMLK